jgi:hypothetical protein
MKAAPQPRNGGNVFGELVNTVEVRLPCRTVAIGEGGLGQITACLTGVVGKFRPMV